MNTAEVLIRSLESEGVKYIFGIPGEETLELMEAIKKSSIKFITVRHEQGAAFMADVYGRLTGKAGVCLSTLGPGATNLVKRPAYPQAVAAVGWRAATRGRGPCPRQQPQAGTRRRAVR